ncbi:MAG: hypothetical protein HRU03_03750 [Nanoarchaeales archaeon]|nr:hypothetical protein [Nanoarchaeales archaeon]
MTQINNTKGLGLVLALGLASTHASANPNNTNISPDYLNHKRFENVVINNKGLEYSSTLRFENCNMLTYPSKITINNTESAHFLLSNPQFITENTQYSTQNSITYSVNLRFKINRNIFNIEFEHKNKQEQEAMKFSLDSYISDCRINI